MDTQDTNDNNTSAPRLTAEPSLADHIADNWPDRKYRLDEIVQRIQGMTNQPPMSATAEAAEILDNLMDGIRTQGNYSAESTLGFLCAARQCLNAQPADASGAGPLPLGYMSTDSALSLMRSPQSVYCSISRTEDRAHDCAIYSWLDLQNVRGAAAQAAPQVPAGWKLVPETPTQAMCQDGQEKAREWPKFPLRISPIYRAMIAAAPQPPAQAAPQPEPPPKRYRVKKDAGSSFARVVDTEEGREVKRFNVVRRPDDWEVADRLCKRLNRQHEVGGAAAPADTTAKGAA